MKVNDGLINFASVEDIIIHKIFAGRSRDLEDIKSIILKNPDFDIGYIKKWLKEFDRSVKGKNLLKSFHQILRGIERI